ncbi:hypothetical protein PI23P_06286 [Polaribacter irgensii 23-P]|uniref:DUF2007 domain-containing protein n=1 Tax=Polaribacter irgensii 23-P TaxID=313594 RepID=A4C356_9FLAO|nr:DUF2007 domain-containing protein [Polaribacter irgensii]EAR11527.1 hypothetical protein PI23P_06286 [Polaribacter irgensii 23-P]
MNETYTKVFTDNAILVNRLYSLLSEAGIDARISDRVESARLGGFGVPVNSVELFIFKKDVEKAEPIIAAYKLEINS